MFIKIIFFVSLLSFSFTDDKLVFVLTHFRHGARAPQKYYNDKLHLDFIKEKWDRPGELTGVGQRMHYLLGLRNRERYVDKYRFLSPKFDPHEILIYSTKFNRTLLSAASQLQGLYPVETGELLITDKQKELAVPMVNLSSEIITKQEDLDTQNFALPNQISLAPIRMINDNERKAIIYDIPKCLFRRDEMREKNFANLKSLQDIVNRFNTEYADKIKKMYDNKDKYDIHFIDNFCDAFVAGTTEDKEMKEIRETDVDMDNLIYYCIDFNTLNFRDWISGDKERTLATMESSKLMREFIYYMNQRVEADIKGTNITAELQDYSRPKMLMISGHDTTVSAVQMFFTKIFGNNDAESFYNYPKFAAQIAFEIVVDENKENKTRDDYLFKYYFNDDLILNMTIDEFINKVEPELWTDKQIDEYCHFDEEEKEEKKEETSEVEKERNLYFILMIVFSCLSGLFLILLIFMIIKSRRKTSESIDKPGSLLMSSE